MRLVVAICTYRRPDGLARLLDALTALEPPVESPGQAPGAAPVRLGEALDVVVIDNDAAGAGLALARERAGTGYAYRLHAHLEPEPGLSAARNRAVAEALALGPDLVAFLDDDEWPERQWLAELVRVRAEYGADAVGGPTRPVFPEGTDAATRACAYYGADLGVPDGAACRLEAGGNFLTTRAALEAAGPPWFDPAWARTGGEDLAFFTALARRGGRMRWAARAVVHEPVAPERLGADWLRARIVNIANTRVRIMQRLEPTLSARAVRGIKTAGLCTVALALSGAGLASGALAERGRLLRWKAWGKLTAHAGRTTLRGEGP